MMKRNVLLRSLSLLALAAGVTPISWAGGAELAGFGGGITLDGGVGTHGVYGATAAYRLGDNVHLFGEFSYSTLASTAFSNSVSGVTVNGNASVNLASFGGGADYSFRSGSKIRPYALGALGAGHFYGTGSGTGSNGGSANVSLTLTNAFSGGVGAGVRFYLGEHFGLKPEVRYVRYQSSVIQANTVVYTVGLFYQFGK